MRKRRLVADRFVGPAFPREHRVLGFDGLIRAGQRCDPEKLAEKLATEHPVVLELLIPALEYACTVAVRRRR